MQNTLHPSVHLLIWFVILLLYSVHANDVKLCSEQESVDITNGIDYGNGSVLYRGVQYSASQYFQDGNVRRGCICLLRQCIFVCDAEEWASVGLKELYANVSDATGADNRKVNLAIDSRYYLILEQPSCDGDWLVLEQDHVNITSKGDLSLNDYIFSYPQFCMLPKNEIGEFHASFCDPEISDLPHQIYAFGFLVSLPFLVATFVVYAILPELQNVSGMSLMCYVAALAISFLLLAMGRLDIYDYQSVMCRVSAYTLYFTLMASFFWLNVMSFDIYWTLGGSRGQTTERMKFLYYSLYAWGTPFLLLSLILLFDHTEIISYHLRPNVGEEGCFLKEEKLTQSLYLYLPLLLLISANIFFFVGTAKRFSRNLHENVVMMNNDSAHQSKCEHDHNRFGLYLRLFFFMGITWSLEIISWLVTEPNTASPSWVVYLLDVSNCLAGIIIFYLFVCNQRVIKLLLQRFIRKEKTSKDGFSEHTSAKSTYVQPNPCNRVINMVDAHEYV
ncbi:G-protein coupled receptor Mth2-like isoform X2 [Anopheles darlingi]|uniref:G-protein coupled receptor Mth2-like isoform X2 n=1 Tax=Anopheles darlingi TaxID=43151 RepID=UPI00210041DF|nr:G-protein coupled receptor Mth2-like isoform X2 [Anopheles darlingi]